MSDPSYVYHSVGRSSSFAPSGSFHVSSHVRAAKLEVAARDIYQSKEKDEEHRGPISNAQILSHLFFDKMNILLLAIPFVMVAVWLGWGDPAIFGLCFLSLIPLAKLLGDATEHLAENLNQTIGGLLNATFGNAVEMIITINAIKKGLLEVVKKSLLGSILSNLLLVLGMAFFAGGLTRSQQTFPGAAAVINITMLFVGIMAFSLPTVFAISAEEGAILWISRISAVFIGIGYIAYLIFQLHTHADMFEDDPDDAGEDDEEEATSLCQQGCGRRAASGFQFCCQGCQKTHGKNHSQGCGGVVSKTSQTPCAKGCGRPATPGFNTCCSSCPSHAPKCRGEEEEKPEKAVLSVSWAMGLLLVSTIIVAVLSEYMVDSIDGLVTEVGVPRAFVGVILLPIVGNACEHASAIRMAYNNKVATAIAIAVGSSTQIALLVMPFSVLVAWALGQPLDLNVHPTGLVVVFMSVLVVFSIVMDGSSNWLEGFMLVLAYCLVAVLFWFTTSSSEAGPSPKDGTFV